MLYCFSCRRYTRKNVELDHATHVTFSPDGTYVAALLPPLTYCLPSPIASPHGCCLPSWLLPPLMVAISPHGCYIPSWLLYPLMVAISPHGCYIPSWLLYPLMVAISPAVQWSPIWPVQTPSLCFASTNKKEVPLVSQMHPWSFLRYIASPLTGSCSF